MHPGSFNGLIVKYDFEYTAMWTYFNYYVKIHNSLTTIMGKIFKRPLVFSFFLVLISPLPYTGRAQVFFYKYFINKLSMPVEVTSENDGWFCQTIITVYSEVFFSSFFFFFRQVNPSQKH